ncbi:MAG TPA: hypothetical protein VGB18_01000 [Candidatus Thermoplasmatota archaeon]
MTLQALVPKKSFVAVSATSGLVHIVESESPFARSLCKIGPVPEWDRVWQEPVNRLSRPLGLCRQCWQRSNMH